MGDKKIKVLVIEDSGLMRILISDILRSDKNIEVVATATNGKVGVEKVLLLKPDVVITDMVMPDFDGLYVVKTLMKENPVPIILLSSLDRANPQIFDGLKEGAIDFVDKPKDGNNAEVADRLKVLISQAVQTRGPIPRVDFLKKNSNHHTFDELNFDIIGIGASTGGPGAIEYLINNLPNNLSIPVVIAQHMPDRFIHTFSERLKNSTGFKIKVAEENEHLKGGIIYLLPGTSNMGIQCEGNNDQSKFTVVDIKYPDYNAPSVTCLFESLATCFGKRSISVLLTGMGKDGAEGLLKVRKMGGITIAQDQESSVVFGMPKAAIDLNAASHVMPLKHIPGFIVSCL